MVEKMSGSKKNAHQMLPQDKLSLAVVAGRRLEGFAKPPILPIISCF